MAAPGRTPRTDPFTDPMPARIKPMLARPGQIPERTDRWAAEIKWDGYRAAAHIRHGEVELVSRNGRDISARFPEIRGLGTALGGRNAILDGEIVAFDENGLPSFSRLQRLFHADPGRGAERAATYVIFDLLYLDGRRLTSLPYRERRELLESLPLAGPAWQLPEYVTGDLEGLMAATREKRLEGLILKRLESRYEPGMRTGAWVKVKNVRRQEFVIGGWLPGEGARSGSIGALLVGVWQPGASDESGGPHLRYAGRVGTGFDADSMALLQRELESRRAEHTPFDRRPPPRAVHVRPELVAEVEFAERTSDGMLRHPSFKGLRDDKDPAEVGWEEVPVGSPTRRAPSRKARADA